MKVLLTLLLALSFHLTKAQIKTRQLAKNTIPSSIRYQGKLVNAVTWNDQLGAHYVITSETGNINSKSDTEEDNKDAELFAYHYIVSADSTKLIWKLYDFVKDCPLDLEVSFIKKSFAITDLNRDGQAEVWLMYKMSCRGDVSPSDMKVILYEDGKKHALRGRSKVRISEKGFEGGEYNFDAAFKNAPEVFQNYAKTLWQKNVLETWD